ncbi:MAG: cyclic nucleotide-binding domain-containing protein [bacterium]|nr:cyclic nucleotide-binding domain-containing protein [bacterium]
MENQQTQSLINIVSKLRVFQGLGLSESARLLKVCSSRTYGQNEIVYNAGEQSGEMFILLQGKLKVIGQSGAELGDILPGTCCGEMGIFTGQPRSATVVAIEQSTGFAITKSDFRTVLRSDTGLQVKIQQNIITMLCERLQGADMNIDSYAGKLKQVRDEHGI